MNAQEFRDLPDLERELLDLVGQVPPGRVSTYGTLATALGNAVAARWVGHFLLHHDHSADCSCHRIVRVDGTVGQYVAGGSDAKSRRLESEGVEVRGAAVDVPRYRFDGFRSTLPLARLTQVQEDIATRISLRGRRTLPKRVAGVDVSYMACGEGVAAYVLFELETGRQLWATTVRRPVRFPYITSYLSFREIPLLLDVLEAAASTDHRADLLLVDGSGVLHPRGAGIAAHLGAVVSMATIGVTKKILCGSVDLKDMGLLESRPVRVDGKALGVAIRPTARSSRPIFVSPGHKSNVALAEAVVRRLLLGRRLPEPLYWADRLSRAAARNMRSGHSVAGRGGSSPSLALQ
ncbi:MAG: hypothetical protein GXY83_35815 [Rhodopirellula sp.]|nr:hypothetical protein [Rhodopirellula sp.]